MEAKLRPAGGTNPSLPRRHIASSWYHIEQWMEGDVWDETSKACHLISIAQSKCHLSEYWHVVFRLQAWSGFHPCKTPDIGRSDNSSMQADMSDSHQEFSMKDN